jgi:hypothetical protein
MFFFLYPISIYLFFLRNACRNQETDNLQTEIIRNHASQYSEPSSRRGSVGVSIKDHLMCKHL